MNSGKEFICRVCYNYVFFFFKQKTAYEMRISDWSSDVCSSDLLGCIPVLADKVVDCRRPEPGPGMAEVQGVGLGTEQPLRFGEIVGPILGVANFRTTGGENVVHRAIGVLGQIEHAQVGEETVHLGGRSEERRVGKECVSTFRSGG